MGKRSLAHYLFFIGIAVLLVAPSDHHRLALFMLSFGLLLTCSAIKLVEKK